MSIIDYLAQTPSALFLCTFIISLLIGSFLNVVIYRLPVSLMAGWKSECETFLAEENGETTEVNKGKADHEKDSVENNTGNNKESTFNIAYPASHCPSCKAEIKAWQNIPIISYLLLKGRCHACKIRISPRYPLVELATALLSTWCVYSLGFSVEAGLAILLTWALISLTMIDIDHHLLPDNITLPLLWLGLLANTQSVFASPIDAIIGAAAGYMVLWSIYWAFKLLTNKEGMGFGDFKLLAALGAWMGWQALPLIIILSSLVGAIIGIGGILLMGKEKNKPIPFGPYLAIAGWIALFWGSDITRLYLGYAL